MTDDSDRTLASLIGKRSECKKFAVFMGGWDEAKHAGQRN